MKNVLSKLKLSLLLLAIFFINGCTVSENVVLEEFQSIPNSTWGWNNSRSFTFTIEDSTHYYNLSVGLRVEGTYAYSNIWLISQIRGNNTNIKNQVQIEIADQTGRWLGDGMSNLISYLKPAYIQQKLAPGTYTWTISQNMRDENLMGVSDIGVKIEKGQPIL
jgi:gliding motility-associated lipoprotein GldH